MQLEKDAWKNMNFTAEFVFLISRCMKKKMPPKKGVKVKLHQRLPKKLGNDAYAYTAAIVEDLKSSFRAVAENQKELGGKVEILTHQVGILKEDVTGIKISQELMREDIISMKGDISKFDARQTRTEERQTRMEADIKEIKNELKSIRLEMADFRMQLSQKADIERFNRLETRVTRIEQELQSRQ